MLTQQKTEEIKKNATLYCEQKIILLTKYACRKELMEGEETDKILSSIKKEIVKGKWRKYKSTHYIFKNNTKW